MTNLTDTPAYTRLARKLAGTPGILQGDADVLLRYQTDPLLLGYEAMMMHSRYTIKSHLWQMLVDLDNLCGSGGPSEEE